VKKLFLYMIRWQLSTPILAIVPIALTMYYTNNFWIDAAIANVIGSLIFFWVDTDFKPAYYDKKTDEPYCEHCLSDLSEEDVEENYYE